MSTPLVSVCIITYNHQNYIAQAIEGALIQKTDFPMEIVVSDDCSTDNTQAICIRYQKKYPDIIRLILHEKNIGSKANLIDNIENCKGKYIACVEGDDYWIDPGKIQLQVEFMEKNPEFSMSFTNISHVNKEGKLVREMPDKYSKDVFTHDDLIPNTIPPSLTTVFKKEFWPEVMPDIFYTIKHSDAFIKALISQNGPVKYFNTVTGCYRIHDTGMFSGASFEEKNKNKMASFKAILNYFPSRKVKANARKAISNLYQKLSYYYLSNGEIKKFIATFAEGSKFAVLNGQLPTFGFIFRKAKNKLKRLSG